MLARGLCLAFLISTFALASAKAQGVRVPVPYNGQLRTDPDVGNVQGIQRYGRPLKTDPDQGEGYSYHVYPVANDAPAVGNPISRSYSSPGAALLQGATVPASATVLRRVETTVSLPPHQFKLLEALLVAEAEAAKKFRSQATAEEQQKWQKRMDDCNGLATQLEVNGAAALEMPLANDLKKSLEREILDLKGQKVAAGNDAGRLAFLNKRIAACQNLMNAMNAMSAPAAETAPTQGADIPVTPQTPAPTGPAAAVPNVVQSQTLAPDSRAAVYSPPLASFSPYPPPFDWTDGVRNFYVPAGPPGSAADIVARGVGITRAAGQTGLTTAEIFHQPLIQIKTRVVEVVRGDSLNVGTILEHVANRNGVPTLTTGQTINTTGQNFRAISRLPLADLTTSATSGTGTLVNLTTEHINGLVQLLATEANADVVTAPEVVTLNGQNVEFLSGEKLPFQLGQNVIQGTNNNIQQFFYKHVGTMVSVTPRIVSWGYFGEGQGEHPILAADVLDWSALARWLASYPLDPTKYEAAIAACGRLKGLKREDPVPFSDQGILLKALNDFSRQKVQQVKQDLFAERIIEDPCERCRAWKAQDCTIDLTVVVRLSEKGSVALSGSLTNGTTEESNVRAISNVIQVQSGHGVVMAGLIGNRETQEIAKVPVLGDIPVVGFLFRNKSVSRLKTEVLIFIEAQVLDSDPPTARMESAFDFVLGQPYVAGNFLDNPLDYGLYRVGFGSYLPPCSHGEKVFWERFGRKVRKIHTHLDDALQ